MDKKRKEELLKMTGKQFFLETGKQLKENRISIAQYSALWKWWKNEKEDQKIDNFFYPHKDA